MIVVVLSCWALEMLSVLIVDGLLVYLTWIVIALIGGMREMKSVNFAKGSILHVVLRNGKLHVNSRRGIATHIRLEIVYFM